MKIFTRVVLQSNSYPTWLSARRPALGCIRSTKPDNWNCYQYTICCVVSLNESLFGTTAKAYIAPPNPLAASNNCVNYCLTAGFVYPFQELSSVHVHETFGNPTGSCAGHWFPDFNPLPTITVHVCIYTCVRIAISIATPSISTWNANTCCTMM